MPDDGPEETKVSTFIAGEIIKRVLCLTVLYANINMVQHDGMDSIK